MSKDALDTLIDRLREERDQALLQHRRAEQDHAGALRQAEQLQAFRADYLQRFGAGPGQPSSVDRMRHLHHFIGRLDEALVQQRGAIEQAARRRERARELRVGLELRLASVEKLIERRAQQALAAAGRREQKQFDEFAARSAWNRQHGGADPAYA